MGLGLRPGFWTLGWMHVLEWMNARSPHGAARFKMNIPHGRAGHVMTLLSGRIWRVLLVLFCFVLFCFFFVFFSPSPLYVRWVFVFWEFNGHLVVLGFWGGFWNHKTVDLYRLYLLL
jgi:hypothetical protein